MKQLLWIPVAWQDARAAAAINSPKRTTARRFPRTLDTIFCGTAARHSMKGRPSVSPSVPLPWEGPCVDVATHQRTLILAQGLGDTEIKVGKRLFLRVKVTSASDRPVMHLKPCHRSCLDKQGPTFGEPEWRRKRVPGPIFRKKALRSPRPHLKESG